MSQKYLVLADVDGKIRILSMTANQSEEGLEGLCRQMANKLFPAGAVGDLLVQPWPQDLDLASENGSTSHAA